MMTLLSVLASPVHSAVFAYPLFRHSTELCISDFPCLSANSKPPPLRAKVQFTTLVSVATRGFPALLWKTELYMRASPPPSPIVTAGTALVEPLIRKSQRLIVSLYRG